MFTFNLPTCTGCSRFGDCATCVIQFVADVCSGLWARKHVRARCCDERHRLDFPVKTLTPLIRTPTQTSLPSTACFEQRASLCNPSLSSPLPPTLNTRTIANVYSTSPLTPAPVLSNDGIGKDRATYQPGNQAH